MRKLISSFVVIAFFFAATGMAEAQKRYRPKHRTSTTEKVLTTLAVGAVIGAAVYGLSKLDDRHVRRVDHRYYNSRRPHRSYVALNVGFNSYVSGSPYVRGQYRNSNGYWYRSGGYKFYRVPFRYNSRYDRSYNLGWERGYWAGYLQGISDSRQRRGHDNQYHHRGNPWGYNSRVGGGASYGKAFTRSFSVGYSHGFRGNSYGHNGFGFSVSYRR